MTRLASRTAGGVSEAEELMQRPLDTEAFDRGEVHIRSVDVAGDAVIVPARSTARGRASGVAVEGDISLVYWCRDGRIVRGQAFRSRDDALEAARA